MNNQYHDSAVLDAEKEDLARESGPSIGYKVCYADTDALGIVYHGRYIEMSERARNGLLNRAGFTYAMLAEKLQVIMVTQKVEAVYYQPALLEDFLNLRTRLTRCQPAYSIWVTDITRDRDLLAKITVKAVLLHAVTRKLVKCPDTLVACLSQFVKE